VVRRYFQTEEGKYEAALRSWRSKTAHHITGRQKYLDAYLTNPARVPTT
jgi:hypothetical protein